MLISIDNIPLNRIVTNWQSFYTALNTFITDKERGMGKNEDKQLGQFFVDFGETLIDNSYSTDSTISDKANLDVNNIIKNKVLLYLWQDVQGHSSFSNSIKLFNSDIKSFDDLYSKYGKEKIFSDNFIDNFLKPNLNKYSY